MVCAKALADEAIRLEQDVIGENVGSQDQIWASHGGTNLITFSRNGDYEVKPVVLAASRKRHLESSLMLFFSGLSRHASAIAAHTIANLGKRKAQLTAMSQMVGEAMDILGNEKRCVGELGALLDDSWQLKRELADCVSTPKVDEIYDAAMAAGAVGGKLLGAGGGGFLLFMVEPDRTAAVRERLKDLIEVSVKIGGPGSRVVVDEPNGFGGS